MKDYGIYIHEEEVYLRREPNWLLRWGIVLVLAFFVLAIGFAHFFSYNESIKASVILTTTQPPVHIKAKSTGRIMEVNCDAGDVVTEGAVLGVMENTGNVKDIITLKEKLSMGYPLVLNLESLSDQFPSQLRLGSQIRPFYNRFLNAYRNLIFYRSLGNEMLEESHLQQQLKGQITSIENKIIEINGIQRDLEIAKTDFDRYQDLFNKGVISKRDLENKEIGYLKTQREYGKLEQQLNQLQLGRRRTQNHKMQFDNSRLKNAAIYSSKLELEQTELFSALNEWEEQYLLKSPIQGRISFFDVWGKHQNIEENQVVFTVVPIESQELLGRCKVPIRNSGKIKLGQRAIIKLENYPYREWGTLEGEVKIISEVPTKDENEGYAVYIQVMNLVTSYGKTLEFKQEMMGSAEIILEEITLLERIFYQFRHLWSHTKQ